MKDKTMNDNTFSQKTSKYLIIGLSAALILVTAVLIFKVTEPPRVISDTTELPTVAKVTIANGKFTPQTTSVLVGSAVEFVNSDAAPHWVESDPFPSATSMPKLNAKAATAPGESFIAVMDKVGTFTYHDKLNPTITGTISVRE